MLDAGGRIRGIGALGRGAGAVAEACALGEIDVTARRAELSHLRCSGGRGLLVPLVNE